MPSPLINPRRKTPAQFLAGRIVARLAPMEEGSDLYEGAVVLLAEVLRGLASLAPARPDPVASDRGPTEQG